MIGKISLIILVPLTMYLVYYLLNKTHKNQQSIRRMLSNDAKKLLFDYVAYYRKLNDSDQEEFENRCLKFLDSVQIEGVGVELSLKDYILIAAGAIIPIFAFKNWTYPDLTDILVYPSNFNKTYQFEQGQERCIEGMVGGGEMNGQMILSKSALENGFENANDGENTAIHEFVHLLDKTDGEVDGLPRSMIQKSYAVPFLEIIRSEISKIEKGKSDINPYGITNKAEFFAVASEYFFENPKKLKEKHPELYEALAKVFDQEL